MSHTPPVLHGEPATIAYNVGHLVLCTRLWLNVYDKELHNIQNPGVSPVSVPLPVWTFRKRDRSLVLAERTDICAFCAEREFKKCLKYNITGLRCNFFDPQILITDLR